MKFVNSKKKMANYQEDQKNYFKQDSKRYIKKCRQRKPIRRFHIITAITNQDRNSAMQVFAIQDAFAI